MLFRLPLWDAEALNPGPPYLRVITQINVRGLGRGRQATELRLDPAPDAVPLGLVQVRVVGRDLCDGGPALALDVLDVVGRAEGAGARADLLRVAKAGGRAAHGARRLVGRGGGAADRAAGAHVGLRAGPLRLVAPCGRRARGAWYSGLWRDGPGRCG